MIQGLHYHHSQDQISTSRSIVEKSNSATQIHAAKIGCELCEMIKQQSQYYDLPGQINPVLVLGTSRLLTFSYLPQHPLAYIHAAANKGPPSLQV